VRLFSGGRDRSEAAAVLVERFFLDTGDSAIVAEWLHYWPSNDRPDDDEMT